MSHGSHFSIRSAITGNGVTGNTRLHLATAFMDGKQLMWLIAKNPLMPDDETSQIGWASFDPRRHAHPCQTSRLILSEKCVCRIPESRLGLHDRDLQAYNAYVEKLITQGNGVAHVLLELEETDDEGDAIVAHRLTLALIP